MFRYGFVSEINIRPGQLQNISQVIYEKEFGLRTKSHQSIVFVLYLCKNNGKMNKQYIPVILLSLLILLLIAGFFLIDHLNDFISEKMKKSAGTEIVLSGEQWVDSLFNYTQNGQDFEYTLLQFRSSGCTICKQMEPELEKIKNTPGKKVNVNVLNVMNVNSQNVMKYFGISVVPTHLVLDKQGNEMFKKYGFIPAEELLREMQ